MFKALVRLCNAAPKSIFGAMTVWCAFELVPEAEASQARREQNCLATAIYFEARGESAKGQRAVADVILARTRVPSRPKTICGVVFEGAKHRNRCQFSFACDGRSDIARGKKQWAKARRIAAAALAARGKGKSVVRGATFYHAHYVKPRWAKRMVKVAQIGGHIFYRPRRGHTSRG